jgi:16S rRNA (guanine527-N7)-methyltransferase
VSAPTGASAAGVPVDAAPPESVRAAACRLFGPRLEVAQRYATFLLTAGVVRGLLGPREAPRIWERHLLNCAVVADLVGEGDRVIDVGSGAGLPGVVLAIARPDLSVVLMEPLARRATFLAEVVADLRLERVEVVRARAEESVGRVAPADVVTARAVAPLDRLMAWCLPLALVGGRVLALKGESAGAEMADHTAVIRRLGGSPPRLRLCGEGLVDPPASVVEVTRDHLPPSARPGRPARQNIGRRGRR